MRAGAIAALLALAIFILTLIWDQQQLLWLAAIAFPVGCVTALFALWLSISLQRFYATTANANANAPEHAKPTSVKTTSR